VGQAILPAVGNRADLGEAGSKAGCRHDCLPHAAVDDRTARAGYFVVFRQPVAQIRII
jgi:hypothetical protein